MLPPHEEREALTLFITVKVAINVTFQVRLKFGWWGEKGQTDGHQFPAPGQASVARVICCLPDQLYVELIPQPLHAPALGDCDQCHVIAVHASLTISHVALHQFEHLTCLFFDGPVASDEHWLFDGAAIPGQHVGDGDPSSEDALRVHVQVFGSPICHAALGDGLP